MWNFFSYILVPKWNYPIFVENVGMSFSEFKNTNEDIEVFFLGTSHMEYGISPMQLYEEYGIVTYNMATSGQPIEGTYYLVNEIFNKGYNPSVIVLDASLLYIKSADSAQFRYLTDNASLNRNKIQLINNCLKACDVSNYNDDYGSFIFPLLRYHSRWSDINLDDFKRSNNERYFVQGFFVNPYASQSYVSKDDVDFISNLIAYNNSVVYLEQNNKNVSSNEEVIQNADNDGDESYITGVRNINEEYFRRINDICNANDTKLVIVKIPVRVTPGDYLSTWTLARHNRVQKLANEINAPFLDMEYNKSPILIDWQHDTGDSGRHLNLLGAEKTTEYLGRYLVDNYDHMSKHNLTYDQKLVLYQKYIDVAHMELSYDLVDYLSKLRNSNKDLVIMISAKDDMISGLSNSDKEALHALGIRSNFDNMEYNYSFIAVISDGNLEYESVSNKYQMYETKIGYDSVSITSAGYLDGNTSSILINGKECSMNRRGINVVVFDKESGLVIDRANCDTWAPEHEVIHDVGYLLFEYQDYLLGRQ